MKKLLISGFPVLGYIVQIGSCLRKNVFHLKSVIYNYYQFSAWFFIDFGQLELS